MTSSTPPSSSADDTLLDLLKSGPPLRPSLGAPQPSGDTASGESLASGGGLFADVASPSPSESTAGVSVGSGNQPLARLILVPRGHDQGGNGLLCCGYVGTTGTSFCIKAKDACTSKSHELNQFKPQSNSYYVVRTDGRSRSAWCHLCIPKESADAFAKVHGQWPERAELDKWKVLFKIASGLSAEDTKDALKRKVMSLAKPVSDAKDLKTPAKLLKSDIKEELDPNSSSPFSSLDEDFMDTFVEVQDSEKSDWKSKGVSESFLRHYENVLTLVKSLKSKVDSLEKDSSGFARASDVASDLTDIMASLSALKMLVGPRELAPNYPDLWSAIAELSKLMANHQHVQKEYAVSNDQQWRDLVEHWIPEIISNGDDIALMKSELEKLITKHDQNPKNVSHILGKPPSRSSVSRPAGTDNGLNGDSSPKLDAFSTRLSDLETRFDARASDESVQQLIDESLKVHSESVRSYIKDILPSLSGNGTSSIVYKHWKFDDEDHLTSWLKTNGMSHPSWGLFVDLVSFAESFGSNHYTDRSSTLSDQYNMSKSGYDNAEEAIVAASFQNLYPSAYGKFKTSKLNSGGTDDAEFDSQEELPGLGTFKKWDGQDGSTGRKFILDRETRNAANNLEVKIRTDLTGDVRDLARSLLNDTRAFIGLFNAHVGNSYQDTLNAGHYSESQAWALTCKQMKRVFLDLHEVRCLARDSYRPNDKWATTAKYIATTLRAHKIMAEYSGHSIKDHPNISAEMTKFVCYSRPVNSGVELSTKIEAVSSNVKQAQSATSKLENRVKKLETLLAEAEKVIKKLKDKAGI